MYKDESSRPTDSSILESDSEYAHAFSYLSYLTLVIAYFRFRLGCLCFLAKFG